MSRAVRLSVVNASIPIKTRSACYSSAEIGSWEHLPPTQTRPPTLQGFLQSIRSLHCDLDVLVVVDVRLGRMFRLQQNPRSMARLPRCRYMSVILSFTIHITGKSSWRGSVFGNAAGNQARSVKDSGNSHLPDFIHNFFELLFSESVLELTRRGSRLVMLCLEDSGTINVDLRGLELESMGDFLQHLQQEYPSHTASSICCFPEPECRLRDSQNAYDPTLLTLPP